MKRQIPDPGTVLFVPGTTVPKASSVEVPDPPQLQGVDVLPAVTPKLS